MVTRQQKCHAGVAVKVPRRNFSTSGLDAAGTSRLVSPAERKKVRQSQRQSNSSAAVSSKNLLLPSGYCDPEFVRGKKCGKVAEHSGRYVRHSLTNDLKSTEVQNLAVKTLPGGQRAGEVCATFYKVGSAVSQEKNFLNR